MTSFALKLIALITMTIDHVGAILLPQYPILRIIGRLSFPIYCFLIAVGATHTRSKFRYLLRLLMFAFVSEIPYQFALYGGRVFDDMPASLLKNLRSLNVFFELALGLLAIYTLQAGQKNFRRAVAAQKTGGKSVFGMPCFYLALLCFLLPAGAAWLAETALLSYGAYGIVILCGFYLFRQGKLQAVAYALFVLATLCYIHHTTAVLQIYCLLAIFPLALYRGKPGIRLPKYLFYVYYPLHLLVLFGLANL